MSHESWLILNCSNNTPLAVVASIIHICGSIPFSPFLHCLIHSSIKSSDSLVTLSKLTWFWDYLIICYTTLSCDLFQYWWYESYRMIPNLEDFWCTGVFKKSFSGKFENRCFLWIKRIQFSENAKFFFSYLESSLCVRQFTIMGHQFIKTNHFHMPLCL